MDRQSLRVKPSSLHANSSSQNSLQTKSHRDILRLVWLYFWLLIFEGALRKWVLPGLANQLLLVRDPVAAGILILALRDGFRFPPGVGVFFTGTSILFLLLGLIQVVGGAIRPQVFIFGFRTYFLHFPVVFVMGSIMSFEDVRKFVRPVLLLALPMTALMVYQFNSGSDALVNVGAGEGSAQIAASADRIRAAGTFSFITGPVGFYSLVLSCCLYEIFIARKGSWNLSHAALAATILVGATAGSRTLVVSLAIVAATGVTCMIVRPVAIAGGLKAVIVSALSFAALSTTQTFQAGIQMMTERTMGVADAEGKGVIVGLVERVWDDLGSPLSAGLSVPIYGAGIGLGTNVGAALTTGSVDYLLAEGEWARVFMETGLLGGLLFIGFRIWLVFSLFLLGLRAARRQNYLALLLFGAAGPFVLNGQWGQTTALGFATFLGGLALAAGNHDDFGNIPRKFSPTITRLGRNQRLGAFPK